MPSSSSSPSTTVAATSSSSSVTVVADSVNRNQNNVEMSKNESIVLTETKVAQTLSNSSTNAPSTTVGHVKEAAVVALDSIGTTTTKKLKKRRRKTTTLAPTTTTTTTTLAPITEAAAEESYGV
jgi:hypothetical protein